MGYIKKLKSNELVGGTDKITIYPVTSTKAVFEEVTEGDKSSFKSQETINKEQQDELDDHEERIQSAEAEDIKSITINGSTKKFEVDDENNVDLTIYTVDSDPEMPSIAGNVGELRNVVGTSTPVLNTSHKTRIETLETTVGTGGTIDSRIATTRAELQEQIDTKQIQLHVGSGLTLDNNGNLSATLDPAMSKVVTTWPSQAGAVKGLIYLKPTSTAGVYEQRVYNDSSYTTLDNVTLSISTDDALNTGSANPLKNSTVAAQIGYFDHTGSNDNDGASKVKNITAAGFTLPTTAGGAIKIKMKEPNTYAGTQADPVQLQFNNVTSTKKTLLYNHKLVSASNTWEENEVISVYYDGTYYQASNAQGGNAMGKKRLGYTESGKTLDTSGDTIGSVLTAPDKMYVKYPVNAGDVVEVSGTGGASGRLWAIAGTKDDTVGNENILFRAGVDVTEHKVLVMPDNAKWVVLNSKITNAEWYYAKAGSVGAHEMITEAYLYGGLRTLAVGQNYEENEAVKTVDKQLLKVTKNIKGMSLTEEIASGDLRTYSDATYQAQSAVKAYTDTPSAAYTSGSYAIGSPAGAVVQVSVNDETVAALTEAVDITVTISGVACTVSVSSKSTATSIAAALQSAFGTQNEWSLTVDGTDDTKLNLISKVAKSAAPTIISSVGESGATVAFVADSAYAGSLNVSQYDGNSWSALTLAAYAATDVWSSKTIYDLVSIATEQNYATKLYHTLGNNTDGSIDQGKITDLFTSKVEYFDYDTARTNTRKPRGSGYAYQFIQIEKTGNEEFKITCIQAGSGIYASILFENLVVGETYHLSFNTYTNGVPSNRNQWLAIYRDAEHTEANAVWGVAMTNNGSGHYEHSFVAPQSTLYFGVANYNIGNVNAYNIISNISLITKKVHESIANEVEELNVDILRHESEIQSLENKSENIFDLSEQTVSQTDASYLAVVKTDNGYKYTCYSSASSKYAWASIKHLVVDKYYIVSFDYMSYIPGIWKGYTGLVTVSTTNTSTSTNLAATYLTQDDGHCSIRFKATVTTAYLKMSANDYPNDSEINISNIEVRSYVPDDTELMDTLGYERDVNSSQIVKYYYGTPLPSISKNVLGMTRVIQPGHAFSNGESVQGCAAWDGYFFEFSVSGKVNIYSLKTNSFIQQLTPTNATGITDSIAVHYNNANFSTKYYDIEDEFPLLYVSGESRNRNDKAYVYRITKSENVFSMTIVQKISFQHTYNDSTTSGYQHIYIDTVDNKMYSLILGTNSYYWYKFNIPEVLSDNAPIYEVTLNDSNVIDSFVIPLPSTFKAVNIQGGIIVNGILYNTYGVPCWANNRVALVAVDVWNKQFISFIDLTSLGWYYEPEGLALYDDHLYMNTGGLVGAVYPNTNALRSGDDKIGQGIFRLYF